MRFPAGLDQSALSGMESAIAKGDFKRVTSIVITQHGRLVYQAYFDGAGDTLRDTRSASKSITGPVGRNRSRSKDGASVKRKGRQGIFPKSSRSPNPEIP